MRISDWSSDVCSSDLRARPCYPLFAFQLLVGKLEQLKQFRRRGRNQFLLELFVVAREVARCENIGKRTMKVCIYQTQRSEEHTSELQSLMRISYAVFCLKKKTQQTKISNKTINAKYILIPK